MNGHSCIQQINHLLDGKSGLLARDGKLKNAGCNRWCCHTYPLCRTAYEIWTTQSVMGVTAEDSQSGLGCGSRERNRMRQRAAREKAESLPRSFDNTKTPALPFCVGQPCSRNDSLVV